MLFSPSLYSGQQPANLLSLVNGALGSAELGKTESADGFPLLVLVAGLAESCGGDFCQRQAAPQGSLSLDRKVPDDQSCHTSSSLAFYRSQ